MLLEAPTTRYCVPIYLSKWTFKDKKNKFYTLDNYIVKGYNKGSIFINKEIVDKAVQKIIGKRKKHSLVPVNLTLKSQHGYGVDETLNKKDGFK